MTELMLGFYVTPVFFWLNAFSGIFYLCVDDMLYDFKLVIHTIQDCGKKKRKIWAVPLQVGGQMYWYQGISLTCLTYYVRTFHHYQISN